MAEPLTEYTRFEFAACRDNIAAGEKIRIIPRRVLADADQGWASEDFSIFDEEIVVLLCYDERAASSEPSSRRTSQRTFGRSSGP